MEPYGRNGESSSLGQAMAAEERLQAAKIQREADARAAALDAQLGRQKEAIAMQNAKKEREMKRQKLRQDREDLPGMQGAIFRVAYRALDRLR